MKHHLFMSGNALKYTKGIKK